MSVIIFYATLIGMSIISFIIDLKLGAGVIVGYLTIVSTILYVNSKTDGK